jgi:hypothetical protein
MEASARRRGNEDHEGDVVYAPVRQLSYSESPSEGYVPSGAGDRGVARGGNAIAQYAQHQPSGDDRNSYHRPARPAPVVEHRSSYQEMKAKAAAVEYNPSSARERDRGGGGGVVVSSGNGRRQGGQGEYESIVTR